jgi:hypothetical protein
MHIGPCMGRRVGVPNGPINAAPYTHQDTPRDRPDALRRLGRGDVVPTFDYEEVAIGNLMIASCARLEDIAPVRRICNEMVIVDLYRLAAESIAAQYGNEHAGVYR